MPRKSPAKPKTPTTPTTRNKSKALTNTGITTSTLDERENERTDSEAEPSTDSVRSTPPADSEAKTEIAKGQEQNTPRAESDKQEENAGDDRLFVDSPSDSSLEFTRACVKPGESRKDCWERIRKEGRAAGLPRHVAYERANVETDRLFADFDAASGQPGTDSAPPIGDKTDKPISVAVAPAPPKDDQGVSGLSDLPPAWPELPANAQLQVEIAWVTANRLRVRDGTGVNLARALSPAPSYSALSWLETSILFPAKFADISVKATASQDDEREHIRREKLAIEEIRSILKEMLEAKD